MDEHSTSFTPGPATAVVSPTTMVLAAGLDRPASGALAELVRGEAPTAALLAACPSDAAVVRLTGAHVTATVRGAMRVVVDADRRWEIEGAAEPSPAEPHHVEGVRHVAIAVIGAIDESADHHVVTSGVVPAAALARTVASVTGRHRRATEPPPEPAAAEPAAAEPGRVEPGSADPFDAMFGHTVARSVEAAAVRDGSPADVGRSPRRALGVLLFSTGERIVVDQPLVLGRNPRVDRTEAGVEPRLVKLPGAGVSRRHAAITIDRWRAQIDDLGSANGTEVTLPGRPPQQVAPGRPVGLVAGARVDLGGDVSFVVEDVA
jgi:hypothetical protein